jgi:gluconolactonase
MRATLASRTAETIFLSALAMAGLRCSSSGPGGSGNGTGGGAGSNLTGNGGHAGNGAGTAGAGNGAGTGAAGTGSGTAGTGPGAAGQSGGAGVTGTAGQAGGGTTGTAGQSGTGFTPFACSGTFSSPTSFPAGSSATRIAGAPPSDTFNNDGNNFTNVEGPVWITDALYVSEFGSMTSPPPARIIKIDASDAVSVAFPSIADTGSNGMAVDSAGHLVTANHGVGGIVDFTLPNGTPMTTLIDMFGGKRFNSPNDLTLQTDGTIYFTDPSFQAPSPMPQSTTGVYMLPPAGTTATAILTSLSNPNGITLALNQQTLYVGHGGGVYSYAINSSGSLGATATHVDPTDLDNNATDGMAIDCAGDLYVVRVNTHDIVVVGFGTTPGGAGTKLATISGLPGNGQLTNVAFGGTDHKMLYITAQGTGTARGVFKLPMTVPGMPY